MAKPKKEKVDADGNDKSAKGAKADVIDLRCMQKVTTLEQAIAAVTNRYNVIKGKAGVKTETTESLKVIAQNLLNKKVAKEKADAERAARRAERLAKKEGVKTAPEPKSDEFLTEEALTDAETFESFDIPALQKIAGVIGSVIAKKQIKVDAYKAWLAASKKTAEGLGVTVDEMLEMAGSSR